MLTSFHFTSASAGNTVLVLDVDPHSSLNSIIAHALDVAHSVTAAPDVQFLTMRLPHRERNPVSSVIHKIALSRPATHSEEP